VRCRSQWRSGMLKSRLMWTGAHSTGERRAHHVSLDHYAESRFQAFARTQLAIAVALMAPDWRAISRPPRNSAMVGMLRISKRCARFCATSVLTFARRAFGSSNAVAFSNSGAIDRHGPHQGAQKSTTTGRSLPAI